MRVKRGLNKKRKHKQVLALTKGYKLSYHKTYKRAKEATLHAGQYSYNDRRKRGGQFRRFWIQRINAALTNTSLRYSVFINKLKESKILLNRKVLASLALDNPEVFKSILSEIN